MSLSPSHAPSSLPGRPCCRIKADPGLSVEPKASAAGPPEAVEDKRAISGEPEAATAGQQQHHYGWPLSWGAAEEQRLGGLGQQGRLPPPPLSVFVCVCVCVCVALRRAAAESAATHLWESVGRHSCGGGGGTAPPPLRLSRGDVVSTNPTTAENLHQHCTHKHTHIRARTNTHSSGCGGTDRSRNADSDSDSDSDSAAWGSRRASHGRLLPLRLTSES